jgi:hypothetical protein
MGKAARNELKKLRASWFNSVSDGLISVGLIGPTVARVLGALTSSIDISLVALLALVCLTGSILLHLAGRAELKELED